MTNTAHANCTHPATKAARAACRKANPRTAGRPAASMPTTPAADPFDLFPQPEDDWADNDQFFGSGDDSGSSDADVLDR